MESEGAGPHREGRGAMRLKSRSALPSRWARTGQNGRIHGMIAVVFAPG